MSSASGLVGSPTVTDKGCDLVVLLDPRMRVGSGVQLTSDSVSGLFKVT